LVRRIERTKGEEMADKDLTATERELAEVADKLASAVGSHAELDDYYPEELIPPMFDEGENADVLSSALYTRPGSPEPQAGFTLWHGDRAYRVRIDVLPL
jgi:hypothetical protein